MSHSNSDAQCDHPDYEALMEFYDALNGPAWDMFHSGWHDGAAGIDCNPCQWLGVSCRDDRVTGFSMLNTLARGTFPDFKIDSLQSIRLQGFRIEGSLPDFSNLEKLSIIDITNSGMTGPVPTFTNLPNLIQLALRGNNFSGSIPDFENLPSLTILDLANNGLTGQIPDFQHLPKLISLALTDNALTGQIPGFTKLPNLQYLFLSFNKLNGKLPNFENIPKLLNFQVVQNELLLMDPSQHLIIYPS